MKHFPLLLPRVVRMLPLAIPLLLILSGCSLFNDDTRIKGGSFHLKTQTGTQLSQRQSQDPKGQTSFETTSERTENLILPAGSLFNVGTNSFKVSSNSLYSITIKDTVKTVQGGSQPNIIGQTIAKLKSLAWLTWLGALVFLFGVVSMFYPPIKLIINSVTTSAAITGAGVLLIALPILLVGHELFILCAVLGAVGIYWFAHRHGSVTGELTALKTTLFNGATKNNITGSL